MCTRMCFEKEAKGNSEMAYCLIKCSQGHMTFVLARFVKTVLL